MVLLAQVVVERSLEHQSTNISILDKTDEKNDGDNKDDDVNDDGNDDEDYDDNDDDDKTRDCDDYFNDDDDNDKDNGVEDKDDYNDRDEGNGNSLHIRNVVYNKPITKALKLKTYPVSLSEKKHEPSVTRISLWSISARALIS